ncbi:MAG: transposase [Oscillospiraceae bacterium]|nr:transposase [Oscillospiraceae bacterium]
MPEPPRRNPLWAGRCPTTRSNGPYLPKYWKDGRPELNNNRAERSMKPYVIDRKSCSNVIGGTRPLTTK